MTFKAAVAQVNPTVGDLKGNADKIIDHIAMAISGEADLVIFPELVITGYPPKDLLLKPSFVRKNREELERIAEKTQGIAAIIGFVHEMDEVLHNAAALVSNGEIIGIQHKTHLPNYDVFDEQRYFKPAIDCNIFTVGDMRIGMNICEDIWVDHGPPHDQVEKGANLIVNISASPFHAGKFNAFGMEHCV